MAKRMLVIADSNALWTKRFLEHVALPAGYEIVLFPIWGHKGKFDDFYRENNVTVYIDRHTLPVIRHIPRVRMWARIWANAKKLAALGPFDVVHNHYISQRDLALGYLVSKKFGARWVASIWGSDLLRASKQHLCRMRPYLEKMDCVHGDYGDLIPFLREHVSEKAAENAKMFDFGHVGYACIDRVLETMDRAACKRHFGIETDSYTVCVGYSAATAQQHMPVLEQLATLPEETLRKITIVLQQTYCLDDPAYVQKTRDYAAALPCKTVVLTEFMDDMEIARLRLASDLFLLSITTDSFCATLGEHFYAGAVVARGDWLTYRQLDDMGIEQILFHDFAEIPAIVEGAFSGEIRPLANEERTRFPALYSWDAVRPQWLSLYQD